MLPDYLMLRQPLHSRKLYKLCIQNVQHRGTNEAHERRYGEPPQRNSRKDDVLDAASARRWKPSEIRGKDPDKYDAKPELRQGLAEQGNHLPESIHPCVPL